MKIFGINNSGFTSNNINNKIKKNTQLIQFYKLRNLNKFMTDTVSFKGKEGLIKPISSLKSSNKKPLKMFFTDIDGTIRKYDGKIPESARKGIHMLQQSGISVIYATGRSSLELKPVMEDIGVKSDYLITQQGGAILDKNGNILYEDKIKPETVKKIAQIGFELTQKDPQLKMVFYIEGVPTSNSYDAKLPTNQNLDTAFMPLEEIVEKNVTKVLFLKKDSKSMDEMNPTRDELRQGLDVENELTVFNSGKWYCEVSNKTTSKGQAIKFLTQYIGLNLDECAAIGDAENDLDMMRTVNKGNGISIAMGNAQDCVFQEAEFKTQHINDDGYFIAIKNLLSLMDLKTSNT